MTGLAGILAQQGRNGDTMLMHVAPSEVDALSQMGALSQNPTTGLPEAFKLKNLLPIIGSSLLGPAFRAVGFSPGIASFLGGTASSMLGGSNIEKGIMSGLVSASIGNLGEKLAPAGSTATSEKFKIFQAPSSGTFGSRYAEALSTPRFNPIQAGKVAVEGGLENFMEQIQAPSVMVPFSIGAGELARMKAEEEYSRQYNRMIEDQKERRRRLWEKYPQVMPTGMAHGGTVHRKFDGGEFGLTEDYINQLINEIMSGGGAPQTAEMPQSAPSYAEPEPSYSSAPYDYEAQMRAEMEAESRRQAEADAARIAEEQRMLREYQLAQAAEAARVAEENARSERAAAAARAEQERIAAEQAMIERERQVEAARQAEAARAAEEARAMEAQRQAESEAAARAVEEMNRQQAAASQPAPTGNESMIADQAAANAFFNLMNQANAAAMEPTITAESLALNFGGGAGGGMPTVISKDVTAAPAVEMTPEEEAAAKAYSDYMAAQPSSVMTKEEIAASAGVSVSDLDAAQKAISEPYEARNAVLKQISDRLKANDFSGAFNVAIQAENEGKGMFFENIIDPDKMRYLRGPMTPEEMRMFYSQMPQDEYLKRYGDGNDFNPEQALAKTLSATGGQAGYINPGLGLKAKETTLGKIVDVVATYGIDALLAASGIPPWGAALAKGAMTYAETGGNIEATLKAAAAAAAGAKIGQAAGEAFAASSANAANAATSAAQNAANSAIAGGLTGDALAEVVITAARNAGVSAAVAQTIATTAINQAVGTTSKPTQSDLQEVTVTGSRVTPVNAPIITTPLDQPTTTQPTKTAEPEPVAETQPELEEIKVEAKRVDEPVISNLPLDQPSTRTVEQPPVEQPPLDEVVIESKKVDEGPGAPINIGADGTPEVVVKAEPVRDDFNAPTPTFTDPDIPLDTKVDVTEPEINMPEEKDLLDELIDKGAAVLELLAGGAGATTTTAAAKKEYGPSLGFVPESMKRKYIAAPEDYRHGFMPEWRFFENLNPAALTDDQIRKELEKKAAEDEKKAAEDELKNRPPADGLAGGGKVPFYSSRDYIDMIRGYSAGGEIEDEEDDEKMEESDEDMEQEVETEDSPMTDGGRQLMQLVKAAVLGQLGEDQSDEVISKFIDLYGHNAFRKVREDALESAMNGSRKEGMIRGHTGGMDDMVDGVIGSEERVAVSPGEFIIPADVVSMLGDGNSDSGRHKLEQMMSRVRKDKTGSTKQARPINAAKVLPA
jgi:hypothetical protein